MTSIFKIAVPEAFDYNTNSYCDDWINDVVLSAIKMELLCRYRRKFTEVRSVVAEIMKTTQGNKAIIFRVDGNDLPDMDALFRDARSILTDHADFISRTPTFQESNSMRDFSEEKI